ncbi:phosphoglucomutase/phosphomannomutase family protein [Candidatus Margulisiibacteriota bacterium]
MAIKFGTDGWRAIISDEFTFPNVRIVAQAIADYIKLNKLSKKGVVIGYDPRFLADKFAEETAKVMLTNDIPCIMMDKDTPTPVVAFTAKDRNTAGAVMVTASHNPPQYCGMKFISGNGGPASTNITKQIEENVQKIKEVPVKTGHNIERFNPYNRYFKHIETIVDFDVIRKAKLKIAYDPLWGTGRNYLDRILQEAGCQVTMIHDRRDVLFGGITPEPIEKNLTELSQIVKEGGFDIGLSTDPDADRFGIVDEKGGFITANQAIAVLFSYLLEARKESGSVVRSVATTHMVDAVAKRNGIKLWETPVGFKYIAEIMLREPVVIGGEESGGMSISDHVPEKDGLLAGLLVCEMVARSKKPLSEIVKEAEGKYGSFVNKRVNMKLPKESKELIIRSLEDSPPKVIAGLKLANTSMLDGVKMMFTDGSWILARPSGTEDLVRTYYESSDDKKVNAMISDFQNYVNSNVKLS